MRMNRFMCLFVSCISLCTVSVPADVKFNADDYSLSELMEIRSIIDDKINELADAPSTELPPGTYVAGKDIAAGPYIIHGLMDEGPDGYTPKVFIFETLEDVQDSESTEYHYMEEGEKEYVNLSTDNVIEVCDGTVSIEQAPTLVCSPDIGKYSGNTATTTATLVPGYYVAGKDIVAGAYILQGIMNKGPSGYTPQVLIAESLEDAQNSDYLDYHYLEKGETWRVQLDTDNVIEVSSGDVCIQNVVPLAVAPDEEEQQRTESQEEVESQPEEDAGDKLTVVKGVYVVGRDIDPGSYMLNMTDCKKYTVIATFANSDDLSSYTSWASANNLKEYGKTALYIEKDSPTHITLEDGDVLYIADGQGYITESPSSTIMKGLYYVGTDLQPGSYLITLNDFYHSAEIATFKDSSDLLSYITWDSANNLEKLSTSLVYANEGEQFHITLVKGEYLYISDGTGSYTVQ